MVDKSSSQDEQNEQDELNKLIKGKFLIINDKNR